VQTGSLSRLTPLLVLLALAATGGLMLPIAGYLIGKRVIGAYEGKLGLRDYLSSIYEAAGHGEVLAWWLLLAPAMIAALWYVVIRSGRRLTGARDED
jgi:hypothetical protein